MLRILYYNPTKDDIDLFRAIIIRKRDCNTLCKNKDEKTYCKLKMKNKENNDSYKITDESKENNDSYEITDESKKNYTVCKGEGEDLLSECLIKLSRYSYSTKKGANKNTWFALVENGCFINMNIRFSKNNIIYDDNIIEKISDNNDIENETIKKDTKERIIQIIYSYLEPREIEAIIYTYFDEPKMSDEEIAKKMGLSRQALDRLRKRALKKLGKLLLEKLNDKGI